jgi:N-acetylglucosaminyl-diphospho-decaprenol L-rhamnosyltransferase
MQDVCVVMVADGGGRQLGPALAGVLKHAGWLDLDAVVVDNGDGSAAAHVEECFIDVRTIRCADDGLGHAQNLALQTVRARYVLFLSPDVEVREGSLATLVSALDRNPEIALAGVRQLDSEGALLPSMKRFPSAWHMLAEALGLARLPGVKRMLGECELDKRKYEHPTACDWTTRFMLVRSSALKRTGWFDERFRFFAGEADLCLRLKRAGWGVFYMPCLTVSRGEVDQAESPHLEAQAAYARMQFARKHFPRLAADYRWALALRYAMRVGVFSLSRRYGRGRQRAARAGLATVLNDRVPLKEPALQ